MQAEDSANSGDDSDFTIVEDTSRRDATLVSVHKPFARREVKPKIAKPAEYRHAIAREALTDHWEDEVEQMPDRSG